MQALRIHIPARTGAVEGSNSGPNPSKLAVVAELGLQSRHKSTPAAPATRWCEELFAVIFSWLPTSDSV